MVNSERTGIMQLMERLEQLVSQATRIPFTDKVILRAQPVFELLDELRSMLPVEISEAQRLARERDRILAEATRQAEIIKQTAHQEAEKQLQDTEIMKLANSRAQEMLRKAESVAQEIYAGAESYADEVLSRLEVALEKALANVRQGRQELKARRVKTA